MNKNIMRLKCLACDALARIVYLCASQSSQIVDVELFRLGLHAHPTDLRKRLQQRIDKIEAKHYDAVIMAYGLCGRATAGLQAKTLPLVIPRAHDCITLFLGSREQYAEQFESCSGTYWYTRDYIERSTGAATPLSSGADMSVDLHDVYEGYVEKYGKDNAKYLMDVMGTWHNHYQRAVFIDMGISGNDNVEAQAREEAAKRGWTFERIAGSIVLIRRLLNADWEDDFLILKPGETLAMSYDQNIITSG